MRGKVVFSNPQSCLVAAYVGKQQYIVFEHPGSTGFNEGDIVENLRGSFGPCRCLHEASGKEVSINILSSAMSHAKAKLVVAPWLDESELDDDIPEANLA